MICQDIFCIRQRDIFFIRQRDTFLYKTRQKDTFILFQTERHIDGQKDTIIKNSFLIIKNFKSTNLKFCFSKTLQIHMYKICLKFHDDLLSGCGDMGGTKSHEMDK